MLIYQITNKVNGKIYIGKTIQTLRQRWRGHINDVGRGDNRPICNAIRKHGTANFEIKILAKPDDIEAMNFGEEAHILAANSMVPAGYNAAPGGYGFTSETASSVQKQRWANMTTEEREKQVAMLRENASRAGKAASHPSRAPWNKGLKGSTPWNKGMRGIYSEETLQKMSKAKVENPRPKDSSIGRFVSA